MPVDITVRVEGDTLVVGRLQLLGEAARVFGSSKVFVGSSLNYASYVVSGTKPHPIYPRSKKALYWSGARHPVAGNAATGRGGVSHPGTKPNPFMQNALEAVGPQIETHIVTQIERVANGEGGNYTQILMGAGLMLQAQIQRGSPVKTGGLRASFHTERVS